MCRIATAGWRWTRAATGTCATSASSRPVPFHWSRGSRIEHRKLIEFIERNYAADPTGCWFFQNGPQRVYVELEAAPWVWRVAAGGRVASHTGLPTEAQTSWLDEQDRLFLVTPLGLGIVHSMDMHEAAQAVEQGLWRPEPCGHVELLARHGVQLKPQVP